MLMIVHSLPHHQPSCSLARKMSLSSSRLGSLKVFFAAVSTPGAIPALFTGMSIRPNSLAVSSTARNLVHHAYIHLKWQGFFSPSFVSLPLIQVRRIAQTQCHVPRTFAKASEIARLILAPPVTNATRPFNANCGYSIPFLHRF
jgi:hypothetical protein